MPRAEAPTSALFARDGRADRAVYINNMVGMPPD
jgi:hypothetical protein